MGARAERFAGEQVLATWLGFDPEDPETGGRLRAAGLQVRLAPKLGARTCEQVRGLVGDAVAAIVSTDPFDRSVFEGAPRLAIIARVGVGVDSIDVEAATAAGVVVTTTPGANSETTADHTLALLLAAVRRIVEHDASVRRGEWNRAGELTAWDLRGTTVGVVGFGEIGQAVARRLQGFGVELLVCDPAVEAPNPYEQTDLDELLGRADIVTLHLPLLEETRGIIGPTQLALMRPDAIIVNASRGGLIDEAGLIEALRDGRLRAAALDVFEDEPPLPSQLLELPNVVLTPHIGGLSVRSIQQMTRQATSSVLQVLRGSPQREVIVNPAALEHPRFHRDGARA